MAVHPPTVIEQEIAKPRENTPSIETLPVEILLEIAENHLTLETLVHWTKVSAKLAGVAWRFLYDPKFWATSLSVRGDHARLGIERAPSRDHLKMYYRVPDPVIAFVKKNKHTARRRYTSLSSLQITDDGYLWRQAYVICRSSIMARCEIAERAKTKHEPCWETGWCECTGGVHTGRGSRRFDEIEKDDEYGCCARGYRHW
ncbi:hypothetical protein GGR51DRAFT_553999 [Nemania sp. FL0031]|nr:hypothetical protein GGR51DRAFT_553999 [Nemania sp. FL0031]